MGSKLTLHFQLGLPGWTASFIQRSGVHWLKVMDPGESRPLPEFPELHLVVRFYEDETTARDEILKGRDGAWLRLKRLRSCLAARPWLRDPNVWLEDMNEPSNAGLLSNKEGRQALDAFTAGYARLMAEEFGIKTVGYCLGVGHPEPGHVRGLFSQGLPALVHYGGRWALHEYGWPSTRSGDGWWTLRYRRILAALHEAGIGPLPPLLITECGLDRLLSGEVGGWKQVRDDAPWYVHDELAWYDRELQQDPEVEMAFVYTGAAENTWRSYEVTEADAEVLADYIHSTWQEGRP